MAYTRNNMASFLSSRFALLASKIKDFDDDDLSTGWAPAIDAALLEYGEDYDDLQSPDVDDADIHVFQKLLRYFGMQLLIERKTFDVDIRTEEPSPTEKRGQAFDHLEKLIEKAKADCQADGYLSDVSKAGQFGYQSLVLDVVEPLSDEDKYYASVS